MWYSYRRYHLLCIQRRSAGGQLLPLIDSLRGFHRLSLCVVARYGSARRLPFFQPFLQDILGLVEKQKQIIQMLLFLCFYEFLLFFLTIQILSISIQFYASLNYLPRLYYSPMLKQPERTLRSNSLITADADSFR